jgi:hypothetical protein
MRRPAAAIRPVLCDPAAGPAALTIPRGNSHVGGETGRIAQRPRAADLTNPWLCVTCVICHRNQEQ